MTLLELTSNELRQNIEAELSSNPALELADQPRCPMCHKATVISGLCPMCSRRSTIDDNQPIIFVSPYTDFTPRDSSSSDEYITDEWSVASEDLPTFVMRQVALELAPEDRQIVAHILTSLDEDGLLRVPLTEFARYFHVPIPKIESLLQLIQHAEPVGVGSQSPQEALLVQIEHLKETRSVPLLADRAIRESMDLLSRRAYHELGRSLGISAKEAQKLADFISDNLNPYPARAHWGENHSDVSSVRPYTSPDIIISVLHGSPDTPLIVEIISPYTGALRVNPLFREALNSAPPDKIVTWQAHLDRAGLLVKCLQQRNHTMTRLMQRIVNLQRHFIMHGDAYLLPITRAQLAIELDVHESTISRAVSGKALQLPNRRIIPLSKLFDRSLHVRTALLEIISNETQPMSDTELVEKLCQQGHIVARRTVAKYRSMEGILPARYRLPNPAKNGL